MKMKTRYNVTEACNVPRKMSLVDPFDGSKLKDDEGNTYDFWVYGIQSDVARNAQKVAQRNKKAVQNDDEEAENNGAEYLSAITQGWSNNLHTLYDEDVGEIAFTKQRAVELYKVEDWIARQVIMMSSNTANYDPKLFLSSGSGSESSRGSNPLQKKQKAVDGSN